MARARATSNPAPVQPAGREVPHPTYTSPLIVSEVTVGPQQGATTAVVSATPTPDPAPAPDKES